MICRVWIPSTDLCNFTRRRIALKLGVTILIARDLRRLFLNGWRWLSPLLGDVSSLSLIQILQVLLNLLLLKKVKPGHLIFCPLFPCLLFSYLLLKLSLILILPILLDLTLIKGLICRNHILTWLARSKCDNVPILIPVGRP